VLSTGFPILGLGIFIIPLAVFLWGKIVKPLSNKRILLFVWISSILIFIIFSISQIIGHEYAKQIAQEAYNTDLERQQSEYQVIQPNDSQETKNEFISDEPYFTLNIPEGIKLEKFLDSNGMIAYQGSSDSIMCQISIIDIYDIMNSVNSNYARTQLDYNMYQKNTMDAAYNGFTESALKSMPYEEIVNSEYAINKINDIIFIYMKFEVPDEEGDIIRTSYNFLRNGYTIEIAGYHFKNDSDGEKIIKSYLDSINF
jgi:hypothetical protein